MCGVVCVCACVCACVRACVHACVVCVCVCVHVCVHVFGDVCCSPCIAACCISTCPVGLVTKTLLICSLVGAGAKSLAEAVLKVCEQPSHFKFLYPLDWSIEEKIETIAKEIYHAGGVEFLPEAKDKLERYKSQGVWLECLRRCLDCLSLHACMHASTLNPVTYACTCIFKCLYIPTVQYNYRSRINCS